MKRAVIKVLYFLFIFLIIVDQIIKLLAFNFLKNNNSIIFINNILNFTYVENKGASFGVFSENRTFLILLTFVIIFFILFILKKDYFKNKFINLFLILILSGGISNLIDRIFRGYVIDYIDISFINFPVFNFADCLIFIGGFFSCIFILINKEDKFIKHE